MQFDEANKRLSFSAILFALYCALAPLNMVMNFSGATINKYVGVLVAAALFARLLRTGNATINMKIVGPFLALLLWSLLTCFWSIDMNASNSSAITFLSLAAVFLIGGMVGFSASEIRFIKIAVIVVAAALTFYVAPAPEENTGMRATLQTSAGVADQNGLAANLIFALWMAIDQIREAKNLWGKLFHGIAAAMISYSVLVIASRGALAALVISAFFYFVVFRACKIHPIALLVIIVAGLLVYQYAVHMNPDALRRLSFKETVADGGAGRSTIWLAVWQLLNEQPLRLPIGYGYGSEGAVGYLATGIWWGTHNVYLELLATTGGIGLILFLVFVGSIFTSAARRKDHLGIAVLLAFLTVCFVLGFSKDKGAWNMLLLASVGFDHNQYR